MELQSCHALKRMNGNDDMEVGINEVIWNNENVKYKNNVLFMRNCIENDITDIKDLFIDGVFITVEQLRARVGPCPGLVLQHNVLLNAIPQRCREQAEIWVNPDIDLPLVVPKLGDLRISHLETAAIRKCLVLLRHKNPCCVNFWQRKFPGLHIDDDVFETVFQVTKETRLRVLQFKIIHTIYPTNILLQKMGLREEQTCTYCGEVDYLEHFSAHVQLCNHCGHMSKTTCVG